MSFDNKDEFIIYRIKRLLFLIVIVEKSLYLASTKYLQTNSL